MKIHPKPDNICSYFETGGFSSWQVDASPREPHMGVILQSETQEELDALLPSAEGATARSPRSAA